MAIAFSYTESTNIVVVTGGTSGTPATFADFVTADRAGTATDLLLATAGLANNTLTYAVRPVEDLAILVKCIVAAKTAEADFIFITGTDWRGAAQTESIDVTAGNGTYTTTKYWATITNLDCSDNANGGGTVWADGTIQVTQDIWGVIWDYGNRQYTLGAKIEVGDNSTSTYFTTMQELITFPHGLGPAFNNGIIRVMLNGTFTAGELVDAASKTTRNGSVFLSLQTGNWMIFIRGQAGTVNLYSSFFSGSSSTTSWSANVANPTNVWNSILVSDSFLDIDSSTASLSNNMISGSTYAGYRAIYNVTDIDGGLLTDVGYFVYFGGSTAQTISNVVGTIARITAFRIWTLTSLKTFIDCTFDEWTVTDGGGSHTVSPLRKYSFNLHVSDKDGTNLQDVIVDCEDTNTDACWTAGMVTTDASGDITEQFITYQKFDHTDSFNAITYSPHKFTISKAGYETLVYENITVDGPIDWHLELQSIKHPVAAWKDER